MHRNDMPQWAIDRSLERRGKLHPFENLDPRKTALIVVDLQNAFMVEEVAVAYVPVAVEIVPNVNKLAAAVRSTGGKVFWIKHTIDSNSLNSWSEYLHMLTPGTREGQLRNLAPGSRGHDIYSTLEVKPEDEVIQKYRFSAFVQGASDLPQRLRAQGYDTVLITGTVTNVCCEVLGARRHDAQLQDHHGERRQRRPQRRGTQRHACHLLCDLRRRDGYGLTHRAARGQRGAAGSRRSSPSTRVSEHEKVPIDMAPLCLCHGARAVFADGSPLLRCTFRARFRLQASRGGARYRGRCLARRTGAGVWCKPVRHPSRTSHTLSNGSLDPTPQETNTMKRASAAILALAVLAALPGAASAQDGPVMKRIAETKTITIGHRDASVPLSYLGPDGKAQGYSVDICLKIADAAKEELKLDKIEVKFVPLTPQTRIPLLTAGTVDIICESSTHTLGRSRQICLPQHHLPDRLEAAWCARPPASRRSRT